MPQFLCPKCGRKIKVESAARGHLGVCRGCGATIKIPVRIKPLKDLKKRLLVQVRQSWEESAIPPEPELALAVPPRPAENPVEGFRTTLKVRALDEIEPRCRYIWSVLRKPADAAQPSFSVNGSNNAKEIQVRFYRAGDYVLRVTVTDGSRTITSDVAVQVVKGAVSSAAPEGSAE